MEVETKAGWIYAVRELAKALDDAGVTPIADKPEVAALTPIAAPDEASAEDVATAVNAIIAALKA